MPSLQRITIYPIKSLDGMEVSAVEVLPSGALMGDRRYALLDDEDKLVNGKRFDAIHQIRAKYSEDLSTVTLSTSAGEACFSLENDRDAIATWCGDILGIACRLVENTSVGFPDDTEASGPTLISNATLAEIGTWFDGLKVDEMRRRLRVNLTIDAEQPFWEDRLVGEPNEVKRFRIGDTIWKGRGICQRCAVPTRDSREGTVVAGFASEFSRRRLQSFPEWSPKQRFDHFYRTAINTSLESFEGDNLIRIGDLVELSEEQPLGH